MVTELIYLDYNANYPLRISSKKIMAQEMDYFGNPSSGHSFGKLVANKIDSYKQMIADLLQINPASIIFTATGSEANNLITSNFKKRKIATLATDHSSTLVRSGIKLKVDNQGQIDKHYQTLSNIDLISICYANSETGVIQDIEEIYKYCLKESIFFHIDASQIIGKAAINFDLFSKVDAITVSGHKFGGPIGCSFLILNNKDNIKPLIIGGGQQQNIRSGTEAMYLIAGLAFALDEALAEVLDFENHCLRHQNYLEHKLLKIDNRIKIAGSDANNRLTNTTLAVFKNMIADTLIMMLDLDNIAVSAGSACSYGRKKESDCLSAMGYTKLQQKSGIRISTALKTSQTEIDSLLCSFEKILLS